MLELSKENIDFLQVGDYLVGDDGAFRAEVLNVTEWVNRYKLNCHAVTFKAEGLPTAYGVPASDLYGLYIEKRSPDVAYTGGGIWLCGVYVAPHIYCVVDNDVPADADDVENQDCLSWYDDREDDPGEWFACQGFIRSENVKDLSAEEHEIWARLRETLLREMC